MEWARLAAQEPLAPVRMVYEILAAGCENFHRPGLTAGPGNMAVNRIQGLSGRCEWRGLDPCRSSRSCKGHTWMIEEETSTCPIRIATTGTRMSQQAAMIDPCSLRFSGWS